MSKLIGRVPEIKTLKEALENNKSELIAVYGRRRVGKTFLMRQIFSSNMVFELTGLFGGKMKDQLINFNKEITKKVGENDRKSPTNWLDAFSHLEEYLNSLKGKKKKVIFIDEFPWIATSKSKFLMAFENFWNKLLHKKNRFNCCNMWLSSVLYDSKNH